MPGPSGIFSDDWHESEEGKAILARQRAFLEGSGFCVCVGSTGLHARDAEDYALCGACGKRITLFGRPIKFVEAK